MNAIVVLNKYTAISFTQTWSARVSIPFGYFIDINSLDESK